MLPFWKYAAGYLNKVNKLWATPFFLTRDVEIGPQVKFGRNVIFNCQRVRIGKGCIFQDNTIINADVFEIGDYGTVGPDNFFPGPGQISIGHNFWSGKSCIIDTQGPTTIGNNVGIGAGSQLWTHAVFGDTIYGSRFDTVKPLNIEDDVWVLANCTISPVLLRAQSMIMTGSVVTKDTESNHIYGGAPAVDITDKTGPQFEITDHATRVQRLTERIAAFAVEKGIPRERVAHVAISPEDDNLPVETTVFFVGTRQYRAMNTRLEYELMRYLLPKAKFLPL